MTGAFHRTGYPADCGPRTTHRPVKPAVDVRKLVFAFLLGLQTACLPDSVSADFPVPAIGQPKVGWNGQYLVGRWTPVSVPVTVYGPSSVQLELTAVDPDGNRVNFLSPPVKLEQGNQTVEGLIKVGRLDGGVGVSIDQKNWMRSAPGKSDWLRPPLKPSTRLIVTVGDPNGFDFETDPAKSSQVIKIVSVKASELPVNPLAYDGLTSLVLAGSTELTAARTGAIRDWVAAGGRLVIALPLDIEAARRSLLEWVPVKIAESPAIVREFGGLEAYSGKNMRLPQSSTLSIPVLEFETGEVLAASRSVPFLIRVPFGMGAVTVLAMDLTAKPMTEWKGLSPFCSRLTGVSTTTDLADKGGSRGSQLSSTGITDLSSQLHAIQENFDRIDRVSPWLVMASLLALMVVVGPIDYLIVHRLLKRPHLTWFTFPLFAVIAAFLAASLAATTNGKTWRANQLNILNIDVGSGTARGRHFVNVYSPTTSQSSIMIEPLPLIAEPKTKPTARIIWEGIPESAFGGMLRETGLENGTTYQQQPDGQLTQVPIIQWSSKGLVGDSLASAEGLVESNLRASSTGSMTGTIVHRFASPIEDWMIVYQNRVYRQLKGRDDSKSLPFPPKQIWRVEQPGVFQRELRPYLTGILTMSTPRFGSRSSTEVINQQSTYDPLSLDPFELIRILSFYDDIGGERYTGVTNQLLNDQDFSHLLKLGRAILFGRLNQPLATIQQNHETLQPDRDTSFVRLILPVVRSTELMKDLKRVVPE